MKTCTDFYIQVVDTFLKEKELTDSIMQAYTNTSEICCTSEANVIKIVFNLSKETFPFMQRGFKNLTEDQKEDYMRAEHALLYVAFSRAVSRLLISGVGNKVEWL